MDEKTRRPEWVDKNSSGTFATSVRKGVEGGHDGLPGAVKPHAQAKSAPSKRLLTKDHYVRGVREGDRVVLARAITLIESNAPSHASIAQDVLTELLPFTGKSIRIGITGVPGAGKSTVIESLGTYLLETGHQIAVLAIDPSSSVTRGSVLGDKTRMEKLARDPRCFIRPSPSGGNLGGVARKTRETMLLCEAAGYDTLLVETVGVGQTEITVRTMVDFFLLLLITGAGDELQGIKKGVMELADAVAINKADGENKVRADATRSEFAHALHYLTPATSGWTTPVLTCSALTGEGIRGIWDTIVQFQQQTVQNGSFQQRRRAQLIEWVHTMVDEHLRSLFNADPAIVTLLPRLEQDVATGAITAATAVQELINTFEHRHRRNQK
jgi:LAO/AO transport system kinase